MDSKVVPVVVAVLAVGGVLLLRRPAVKVPQTNPLGSLGSLGGLLGSLLSNTGATTSGAPVVGTSSATATSLSGSSSDAFDIGSLDLNTDGII